MNEPRIIKKYPNRRLYDTAISSYITLEDVRRLVIEQVNIKVIDARTTADITHSTLLQIIIEQEEGGPPLFSTNILLQMIRHYGGSMQQLLSKMFEQGMEIFTAQHAMIKDGMNGNIKDWENNPVQFVSDLAQQNMTNWQQIQKQWFHSFVFKMKETQENPVHNMDCETETAQSSSIKEGE